ncbi:MAG: extracellular solute-binding protein [Candidatus Zixiibacteriota bacterium]
MKKTLILLSTIAFFIISCSERSSEKTTLTWWHFWTDTNIRPVIEQIAADFESTHSDVKVELVDLTWADGHDKIAIAFSSGTGPDIVELGSDWIPEFSSTGHLYNITQLTDSIRNKYLMWEPGKYDQKYYAFPWILGTRVLFANLDLLEKTGYTRDYFPSNWNELLAASEKINGISEDIYGFGSNSAERHRLYKKFLPFMWSNGGRILSKNLDSCLFDSDETLDALNFYKRLCQTGLTDTQRRLEDAFLEGKIGFILSGDWLLKRISREKLNFAFSTNLIPGPDGMDKSISFVGGEYLCINSKSSQPELAFEFIKFVCSPENQIKFCMQNNTPTPSSIDAAQDSVLLSQPHFETFITQIKNSRLPPPHPQWVYIEAEIEKAIEAVLYDSKTTEDAVNDAACKIRELIAE